MTNKPRDWRQRLDAVADAAASLSKRIDARLGRRGDADFDESKITRGEDGKFTAGQSAAHGHLTEAGYKHNTPERRGAAGEMHEYSHEGSGHEARVAPTGAHVVSPKGSVAGERGAKGHEMGETLKRAHGPKEAANPNGRHGYNPESVQKAIEGNRAGGKIGAKEGSAIHRLLRGRQPGESGGGGEAPKKQTVAKSSGRSKRPFMIDP